MRPWVCLGLVRRFRVAVFFFKCRKCESETFQSVFLAWLCVWPFSGLPQRSGSRKRLGPVSPINSHLDLTLCSRLIIGGWVQVSSCFPTVPSRIFWILQDCVHIKCTVELSLNLIRYGGWTGSFVSACPLCFKHVDAVSAQIIQPLCEPAIAHVSCFCQPLNWVIKLIYIIMYQGSADSVGSLVLCVLVIIIFFKTILWVGP